MPTAWVLWLWVLGLPSALQDSVSSPEREGDGHHFAYVTQQEAAEAMAATGDLLAAKRYEAKEALSLQKVAQHGGKIFERPRDRKEVMVILSRSRNVLSLLKCTSGPSSSGTLFFE